MPCPFPQAEEIEVTMPYSNSASVIAEIPKRDLIAEISPVP
jgi:hypothetical protein